MTIRGIGVGAGTDVGSGVGTGVGAAVGSGTAVTTGMPPLQAQSETSIRRANRRVRPRFMADELLSWTTLQHP